jgi:hypothetical protein
VKLRSRTVVPELGVAVGGEVGTVNEVPLYKAAPDTHLKPDKYPLK